MKIKKFIIACLVLVSALITASCTNPEKPTPPLDDTHQHNYILTEYEGNVSHHWNVCTVEGCSRKGNTQAHSGGTATCTQRPVCDVCGLVYGSITAHTYTEKVIDDKYLAVEADCQTPAKYYYSCTCGAKGKETFDGTGTGEHVLSETYTGSATGHYHECVVENCDHTDSEVPHELSTVTEAATCTETGLEYQECSVCGWTTPDAEKTVLDPIPHLYSKVVVVQEPSTTSTGSGKIVCSYGCGTSENITLPKITSTNYSRTLVEGEGVLNDKLSLTTSAINSIANSLTTINAEAAKVGLEGFGFAVESTQASGYKTTLNGEFVTNPTSRPVQDQNNKAELLLTLEKGDAFRYYYNGGLLVSYRAPLNGEYIVYVNKENQCFPALLNSTSTISVELDEQPATYTSVTASAGNIFQYVLNATAGQKLVVKIDGEPIVFGSTNLDYHLIDLTAEYTLFINNDVVAYIVYYVDYTMTATSENLTGSVVYVWAWEGSAAGAWYLATVNADGTISATIPSNCDGMVLAKFAQGTTNPNWEMGVLNQTEDIKIKEGKNEYIPVWKISGSTAERVALTIAASSEDLTNKVVFVWAWTGSGNGAWYPATVNTDGSITANVPSDCTGMTIAKFPQGTAQPDWNAKENQTEDINIISGTTTYTPKWKVVATGSGYGIVGSGFQNGSWDNDIFMTALGNNQYEATIVVTSSCEFKIRKDAKWDVNYGGTLSNGKVNGAQGGPNISITSPGTYKITFNDSTKVITVTKQ